MEFHIIYGRCTSICHTAQDRTESINDKDTDKFLYLSKVHFVISFIRFTIKSSDTFNMQVKDISVEANN